MSIALQKVTSSQIAAIGHDSENNVLAIQFQPSRSRPDQPGSVYHYERVSHEGYMAFVTAKSVGSHFYRVFKNNPERYPYQKVA